MTSVEKVQGISKIVESRMENRSRAFQEQLYKHTLTLAPSQPLTMRMRFWATIEGDTLAAVRNVRSMLIVEGKDGQRNRNRAFTGVKCGNLSQKNDVVTEKKKIAQLAFEDFEKRLYMVYGTRAITSQRVGWMDTRL